jgi:hypothetical protein
MALPGVLGSLTDESSTIPIQSPLTTPRWAEPWILADTA